MPRYLLTLGLVLGYGVDNVGVDCPIGSSIKVKGGGWVGVKEEEDNKEYDERVPI